MPTFKIDNKDYDFDTLSDEAKAQLQSPVGGPALALCRGYDEVQLKKAVD